MTENRQNQLAKLQALEKRGIQGGSKTSFRDLVVCNVGAPVKKHYPKLRVNGVVQKDADGNDARSQQSDGLHILLVSLVQLIKLWRCYLRSTIWIC